VSQSTSAPEEAKPLTLRVSTGSADAEIFVIDHELRLVDRGIGSLVTRQLPGVYKVKVQARRNVQEKTILLVEDASIEWQAQPIDSAAPIRGAARTHEYQMTGAADRSRRVDLKRGTGGSLFVMLRNWSARGATGVAGRGHPGARFRLAAWDRSWDLDLASLPIEDGALDPWCAVNLEVDPGAYLLQCRAGEGSMLEGAVFVSPGWQTQVFLLSRPLASDAAGFAVGLAETGEVLNATVLMSRNGFVPEDEQLQATETARLALADDRPVRTRELDELLRYKLENPMLGIMGAHLLLLAREERAQRQAEGERRERLRDELATLTRQQPPFDQELFDTVIDNLRRLVGPSHPDLQALSLQRSGATDPGPITAPPMLRRSWSLLVAGSNRWPSLVPVDLWRRIAMRTATAPFLSWMTSSADASGTSAYLGELREQLTSKPRTVARAVRSGAPAARSMSPQPGDPEQIATDFDIESPEPADPGHIATEFDIPRAAVEWLVKK
jgi:hypothetical protein